MENCLRKFGERTWEFSPHQSYGALGWIEAGVKTIGLVVAILSWAEFLADPNETPAYADLYPVQRILQMVVFGVLLVLYFAGVAMRWISAEVFAFGFHIFHIVSHIVLLLSLIFQYDPSVFIFIYALLLLLGELIHMFYLLLRTDDALADIYGLPRFAIWAYSTTAAICYTLLLLFQIVISSSSYQQFHGH